MTRTTRSPSLIAGWILAAVTVLAAFVAWRFDFADTVRALPPFPGITQPGGPPSALAPSPGVPLIEGTSSTISDVAERAVQSVVNISTTRVLPGRMRGGEDDMLRRFFGLGPAPDMESTSLGSGVIATADGIVLTNNHVVERASTIKVKLQDGREAKAKLVGADPRSDLAVLKLEGKLEGLKPLPFGNSDRLRLGEVVLAIGSPFGLSQTVTMGIVSAKGRQDMGKVDYEDFIQTDAAINPGNSGGALVNLRGELVGVNTMILSRTGGNVGVGFAIPTSMAKPIMDSLLKNGKVARGWLGVGIQDLEGELQQEFGGQKGVLVSDVQAGSPAEKAGLKRGDVILRLDGQTMDSSRRLRNTVALHQGGTKVRLDVLRDGKVVQFDATLGDSPEAKAAQLGGEAGGLDGLTVQPLDDSARRRYEVPPQVHGVVASDVQQGSPAEQLGLQPGDVLMEVNRRPVESVDQFHKALAAAGKRFLLLVYRDGFARYVMVQR